MTSALNTSISGSLLCLSFCTCDEQEYNYIRDARQEAFFGTHGSLEWAREETAEILHRFEAHEARIANLHDPQFAQWPPQFRQWCGPQFCCELEHWPTVCSQTLGQHAGTLPGVLSLCPSTVNRKRTVTVWVQYCAQKHSPPTIWLICAGSGACTSSVHNLIWPLQTEH